MILFSLIRVCIFVGWFFFQAEDGIRDLVRSRGLGDVYKRQGQGGANVRLEEVADIGIEMASDLITRENAQRKAVISLNVAEGLSLIHI